MIIYTKATCFIDVYILYYTILYTDILKTKTGISSRAYKGLADGNIWLGESVLETGGHVQPDPYANVGQIWRYSFKDFRIISCF